MKSGKIGKMEQICKNSFFVRILDRSKSIIDSIWRFFLIIFFPARCVSCGSPGLIVCPQCLESIEKLSTSLCTECGKLTDLSTYCPNCRRKLETNLAGIYICARYDAGPIREIIYGLKYQGYLDIVPVIGELIVERIRDNLPKGELVVVPVPLHPRKKAIRGFNQAELIARYVSKRLDLKGGNALVRIKNTRSQVEFNRAKRLANMEGAFRCEDRGLVQGKIVLLVDDVVTTGATLNDCARALKEAGAKKIWGAVLARNR